MSNDLPTDKAMFPGNCEPEALVNLRDSVRAVGGLVRANPNALYAMPIADLLELYEFLNTWQPIMISTARELGNLQGRVGKAVKKRRNEVRA